ncbi:MAG: cob(I)yrinic acid a,c-diamide adenosyltransferase [Deltaproteobacteria bacterium]|nr:cob(I)yrinic acid a,c-diamide adenosyltransferase [Deltaproteobacteria bacterium]
MDERPEPKHLETAQKTGLVVVITGNGKGKTTSALGIALRAAGHGMKVSFIQFMKGDIHSGELDSIKRLSPEVEFHVMGKGFCGIMGDTHKFPEHRDDAQRAIALAKDKISSGLYDVVILDEINNSLKLKLVDLDQVLGLLDARPPLLHLVLTGRDAHPEVVFRAHTVSEVREVKHAYRQGIEPQKGIDY